MKAGRPPLSRAQREIMEIVWDRGEVSAFEVRQILMRVRKVARNTVRTLLERMEEKGWLRHRVVGRTHFYSPLVERETNLGERVQDLVDKSCGGSPERLMSALLEYRGLSTGELETIRGMLDQARQQQKKRTRRDRT
jgi:BlaI family transcriptional regulator, penicillinase repressor